MIAVQGRDTIVLAGLVNAMGDEIVDGDAELTVRRVLGGMRGTR